MRATPTRCGRKALMMIRNEFYQTLAVSGLLMTAVTLALAVLTFIG